MVDEALLDFGPADEEELEALRLLASSLARLFSYPSVEEARVFTDGESVQFLMGLAARIQAPDAVLEQRASQAAAWAAKPADERARAMRRELTRLCYRPEAPVSLEGRRWVRRDPAEPEARLGESASVAQSYRAAGLKVRAGVVERADALPTELDFLAAVLGQELAFSHEGNGAQALIWKRRRTVFVERHLGPLARAVAQGIERHSAWPPLLLWAALLQVAVGRCGY